MRIGNNWFAFFVHVPKTIIIFGLKMISARSVAVVVIVIVVVNVVVVTVVDVHAPHARAGVAVTPLTITQARLASARNAKRGRMAVQILS